MLPLAVLGPTFTNPMHKRLFHSHYLFETVSNCQFLLTWFIRIAGGLGRTKYSHQADKSEGEVVHGKQAWGIHGSNSLYSQYN